MATWCHDVMLYRRYNRNWNTVEGLVYRIYLRHELAALWRREHDFLGSWVLIQTSHDLLEQDVVDFRALLGWLSET